MPTRKFNVFLCHAKEDKPTVRELYRQLTAEGWMDVWLDEENLFPGQEWDLEIEKAVEQADVVIVCLSTHSVDKEGYVQKELRFVLNIADEKPEGTIFVIPLRLDDCQVPRRIRAWQWVDYFPKSQQNWAYQRLLESLKLRAGKLGISVGRIVNLPQEPVEDATTKAERERNDKEERESIAAQKAENERKAKEKRNRLVGLIRQQGEERRKATTEMFREAKFTRILVIGIVVLALFALYFGGKFVIDKLPSNSTPSQTSEVSETSEVSTPTRYPPTETPTITITPTPKLGVGSTWPSPKDGMVMMFVPAGEFTMGEGSSAHQVVLDSYWIDKTEVTNTMYAKCVDAGKCNPPISSNSYTRNQYYGNTEYDNFPVIYVSWYNAKAFCEWRGDGTRLPTEAEWEKAASWDANKQEKRVYPWGNTFDGSLLNFCDKNCPYNWADKSVDDGYTDTSPVGNYPSGASFYGLLDMAGNVWEWVADWYSYTYYQNSPSSNPLGPDSGKSRVVRGGSWYYVISYARSSYRGSLDPSHSYYYGFGFRCARSAE